MGRYYTDIYGMITEGKQADVYKARKQSEEHERRANQIKKFNKEGKSRKEEVISDIRSGKLNNMADRMSKTPEGKRLANNGKRIVNDMVSGKGINGKKDNDDFEKGIDTYKAIKRHDRKQSKKVSESGIFDNVEFI